MRTIWLWISSYMPFVIQTRRSHWKDGKNAFDLGRDYERGAQRGGVSEQ